MKAVGIIAEYNPFHNGHAHQISFLKEQGAQIIVAALSGCFVQRGMPAWTDKYLRTRMALSQGVDFVFELPVLYALSSAEGFAFGGVSLLNALPLDGFCFGSEAGNLKSLQTIANFLTNPANASSDIFYQQELQKELRNGFSFPFARERALKKISPDLFQEEPTLLKSSNNILALEYLKACNKLKSHLQPVTLLRDDNGYLSTNTETNSGKVSAMAIRTSYIKEKTLDSIQTFLPQSCYKLLSMHPEHFPIEIKDFDQTLYVCLRKAKSPADYTAYGEISIELAQRIWKFLPEYTTILDFVEKVHAKNFTDTRIFRSLIHIMLGITKEQLQYTRLEVPYLRLLGMNKEKSTYLRQINQLPLITKVADYEKILTDFYTNQDVISDKEKQSRLSHALNCFQTDLLAADIYRQTVYQKTGLLLPDEFHNGIEIY